MPDLALLTSRLNQKFNRFGSQCRNALVEAVDGSGGLVQLDLCLFSHETPFLSAEQKSL